MRAFRDFPIRGKLILLLLVIVGVVLLLCSTAFVVNDMEMIKSSMQKREQMIKSSMQKRVLALAEVLGANTAAALDFNDASGAQKVLASLRQDPTIVLACTYDKDGKVLRDDKIVATYKAPRVKG